MDFPEVGSVWQKTVNDGETVDQRRVLDVVREDVGPNHEKTQQAWVRYVDRRGNNSAAELTDWRRWSKKATKVVDGTRTIEVRVVPEGSI